MQVDTFDYSQYHNGGASRGEPQRPATKGELAKWMNHMAQSVGSGVLHWVCEGKLHYACVNVTGEIVERGLLD